MRTCLLLLIFFLDKVANTVLEDWESIQEAGDGLLFFFGFWYVICITTDLKDFLKK